jgi:hypothetical protein
MRKTLPSPLLLLLVVAPLALSSQVTPHLFARQSYTCGAGKVQCGTKGCAPVDATCCPDNGDYCPSTHYCTSEGCCERGEICTGVGGTSTVKNGPLETDPAPSSSSLPCDPCGQVGRSTWGVLLTNTNRWVVLLSWHSLRVCRNCRRLELL